MMKTHFEWDEEKDKENQAKHNVAFALAQNAFFDPKRIIVEDRFYCIGRVGEGIMTDGAGYWRKGRRIYEDKNKIH